MMRSDRSGDCKGGAHWLRRNSRASDVRTPSSPGIAAPAASLGAPRVGTVRPLALATASVQDSSAADPVRQRRREGAPVGRVHGANIGVTTPALATCASAIRVVARGNFCATLAGSPTRASAPPSSSTTRRSTTTSSPPIRKRRRRSTPAPTSRAGPAPAASSPCSPSPPKDCRRCAVSSARPTWGRTRTSTRPTPPSARRSRRCPAWTFEGIAFYIPMPVNGSCGGNWPVYRSYYSDQISDANHRFTVDLTAHVRMSARRGDILEGIVMCAPVTDEEREADVVRFLEQATLGPTEALVAEVKAKGIEKWLDEQVPLNVTRYTQYPFVDWKTAPPCVNDTTPPPTPEKYCFPNKAHGRHRRPRVLPPVDDRARPAAAAHGACLAPDLRGIARRAAGGTPTPNADFQQRLRDGAFDTFENLLARYALSPQLGLYQSWVQQRPGARRHPAQRELRARADAALHDRRRRTERRRHAEARREGAAHPDVRPVRYRDGRAHPDRLRVSDAPGRQRRTSGATGSTGTET